MHLRHLPIILLGTLLSFSLQAQERVLPPVEEGVPITDPASPQPLPADADQHQHAPHTLDGDTVLEGQHGDSEDEKNPGGAHGDGRTDPGILE